MADLMLLSKKTINKIKMGEMSINDGIKVAQPGQKKSFAQLQMEKMGWSEGQVQLQFYTM